jgi:hypothetical protein
MHNVWRNILPQMIAHNVEHQLMTCVDIPLIIRIENV